MCQHLRFVRAIVLAQRAQTRVPLKIDTASSVHARTPVAATRSHMPMCYVCCQHTKMWFPPTHARCHGRESDSRVPMVMLAELHALLRVRRSTSQCRSRCCNTNDATRNMRGWLVPLCRGIEPVTMHDSPWEPLGMGMACVQASKPATDASTQFPALRHICVPAADPGRAASLQEK